MHILVTQSRTLDEADTAIDLGQTPADIIVLSFSDSDLGVVAAASDARRDALSLRVANLAQLRHPFSVDLYAQRVIARSRFVLVRLLGGLDYWRYGIEELSRVTRMCGSELAVIPGDHCEDPRLDAASTLSVADLRRLWAYFQNGGVDNVDSALAWIETRLGQSRTWYEPRPLDVAGYYRNGCRNVDSAQGHALIVFYRSLMACGDCAPISHLADAMSSRQLNVTSVFVTSLKDPAAAAIVSDAIAATCPDVIVNTTAFSARTNTAGSVLDRANAPVLQAILSAATEEQWRANPRGLGPADLAMNIVLPEVDGRIVTTTLSNKAPTSRSEALQFTRLLHKPIASRVDFVAELARNWARLRRTPRQDRRIACVLSDYPGRGGREGYAVGLDTPASVTAIAEDLRRAGYTIARLPEPGHLMTALTSASNAVLSLAAYRQFFGALPETFRTVVHEAWGDPADDASVTPDGFCFRLLHAGHFMVALQPDRGQRDTRKIDYHDASRPPCHSYIAFYLWIRHHGHIDALVHTGTHGTLEWLPGKAVALDADCAPEVLLGPTPLIYPFIVNNPGEAAQAKRRNAAITIGHLTPPLVEADSHGTAIEIEALFDEYSAAEALDPKRAKVIGQTLLRRARETGLADESGIDLGSGDSALVALDAWLCDVKEMRIRDGLHIFGRGNHPECAEGERRGLIDALDGRFVPGGPAGAPSRGRSDVIPTGRNIFGIDPRSVPTRTAVEIGRSAADMIAARYAQDHGDWPRSIVLDLWASATMRTGGEDLAQAFAHLGVRPQWDSASGRVLGFDILPFASLERPRTDVSLRISGLFRDMFPMQVSLFDQVVRAVAALDEPDDINPLAASLRAGETEPLRVFGGAPSTYGMGVGQAIDADPMIAREALGQRYLASASHAYVGVNADAVTSGSAFTDRVREADAFVHVQDMSDADVLDAQANVEAEAGFSAAAFSLGKRPALYHLDAGTTSVMKVRTQREEIARVVRGRAANPRWVAGQMRHGFRGAAEVAETVDNLYAMALMSDAVASRHFDLVFAATCGDPDVRAFLLDANRDAAQAIAKRFQDAATRGFWTSRRNSDNVILAEMLNDLDSDQKTGKKGSVI